MPALITRHGNGIGIFLNGAVHHFLHTAVVAEVNYFGPAGLHYTTHDINRGIVSVEQGGGGNNTNFMLGLVRHSKQFTVRPFLSEAFGRKFRLNPLFFRRFYVFSIKEINTRREALASRGNGNLFILDALSAHLRQHRIHTASTYRRKGAVVEHINQANIFFTQATLLN